MCLEGTRKIPFLYIDSVHRERGQDNQRRGGGKSKDRKLDCEEMVLIVMDKTFQTGVNL